MADNVVVTDAKGRKIGVRELDPADMLDLLEAAGSASTNAGYLRYATLICSVDEFDGVPVPLARDKAAIKSLAKKLGNDGLVAVSKHLYGDDDAPARDATGETAKN